MFVGIIYSTDLKFYDMKYLESKGCRALWSVKDYLTLTGEYGKIVSMEGNIYEYATM